MNRKLKENFLRKVVFPAKNILNLSFKVQCQGSIRRSNNHKLFLFLPLLKENDSGMKKRTIRIKREYLKGFLEKARDKVIIFFLHFLTFLWHFLKDTELFSRFVCFFVDLLKEYVRITSIIYSFLVYLNYECYCVKGNI